MYAGTHTNICTVFKLYIFKIFKIFIIKTKHVRCSFGCVDLQVPMFIIQNSFRILISFYTLLYMRLYHEARHYLAMPAQAVSLGELELEWGGPIPEPSVSNCPLVVNNCGFYSACVHVQL
jgi:hypothetical protein